jgi:hypothetical protein
MTLWFVFAGGFVVGFIVGRLWMVVPAAAAFLLYVHIENVGKPRLEGNLGNVLAGMAVSVLVVCVALGSFARKAIARQRQS